MYGSVRRTLSKTGPVTVNGRMARVYTILITDDDPDVLSVMAAILRAPGYTVLTAPDGYEAIRVLADRHVDLLLTDLRMPELDGQQLVIQAKVMRPSLHVVYMTGFKEAAATVSGRLVQKPIRAADLVETIKQEMSQA